MINIYPYPDDVFGQKEIVIDESDKHPNGWNKISNRTLIIEGNNAKESVFLVNDSMFPEIYKMQEIEFVKNGNSYEISILAPVNTFNSEKPISIWYSTVSKYNNILFQSSEAN